MRVHLKAWDDAAKLAYKFIDELNTTEKDSRQLIEHHFAKNPPYFRVSVARLSDGVTKTGKVYENTTET